MVLEWYKPLADGLPLRPVKNGMLFAPADESAHPKAALLQRLPIALSEVFIVGQSLPLSAAKTTYGCILFAELGTATLGTRPFDQSGHWRLRYRPMALRCLPYVVFPNASLWCIDDSTVKFGPLDETSQNALHRGFARYANALRAAGDLVSLALRYGMLRCPKGCRETDTVLELAPRSQLPAVSSEVLDCCRLVEAIRFSQNSPTEQTTPEHLTTGLPQHRQSNLNIEAMLSFDTLVTFQSKAKR